MLNLIGKPSRGRLINRSHPLSDGLIFAPIFNEGVGSQIVDHANLRMGSFASAPLWSIRERGVGLDFDGTDDRLDWEALGYDIGTGPFTIIAMIDTDILNPTNPKYIFTQQNSGNTGCAPIFLQAGGSVNGVLFATISSSGTAMTKVSATNVLVTNTIHHVAWAYNGVSILTHANHFLFKNGVEVSYGSNLNGSGTRTVGLGKISIGGRTYDNTRNWDGFIGGVWVWNRFLSQNEIIQHYGNPYAMFQQPSRGKYTYVAAGGAIYADSWHPEIQQPVREKIEIIGY